VTGRTAALTGGASSLGGSAPFFPDKEFAWNGRGSGPFNVDAPFGLERGATDVVVSTGMTEGVPNCVGGLVWAGECGAGGTLLGVLGCRVEAGLVSTAGATAAPEVVLKVLNTGRGK
jgi:hypothetical protein